MVVNFLTTPPKACHKHCKRLCDACRKPINDFMYHCKKDDLDLHPCCRNLKREYKIKGEEQQQQQELEFILHKNMKQKCLWCNKKSIKEGDHSNGWSYISKCNKYHVHVACVTEMFLEEWNNKNETINKINYNVKEENLKALALHKILNLLLFVGLYFVCVIVVHIRCQPERQYFRHRLPDLRFPVLQTPPPNPFLQIDQIHCPAQSARSSSPFVV
ncbi:heat shock cognate 70 kDa protein 2-like isoform X1 [Cucumis melo var. makuwa]|uniref:Heat shock cognate 70 kDa protein 2-like isoform X1 n=1 Tax=Cucumis melo var. makuwa TaxID=1194695 RepID=A0A5A7T0A0_CUCMM|nr:heat shock cognate 70 kDa protein 2-like isoform X1 [Cucumis melo var. makuwa]